MVACTHDVSIRAVDNTGNGQDRIHHNTFSVSSALTAISVPCLLFTAALLTASSEDMLDGVTDALSADGSVDFVNPTAARGNAGTVSLEGVEGDLAFTEGAGCIGSVLGGASV